jgi:hypothetical protein
MPNQFVLKRLQGIQSTLVGVHQSGVPLSASSKGQERQAFIHHYLQKVLPPTFRVGSGDATDVNGNRSGQLDVVIEYPFAPTLPAFADETRLYLAEGVAAVVEVKSNLAAQWGEAERTAAQLAPLRRSFWATIEYGSEYGSIPLDKIPLFVAGYTGWKTIEAVREKVEQNANVAGVLVIDAGLFVCSPQYGSCIATGGWALWGLISMLHRVTSSLQSAACSPSDYATS